jgi:hypothetical protein
MAKANPTQVYRLKITLADTRPPVWRRVEVEDCTLLKLHKTIQVSMGWLNYHAWALDIGGKEYGDDVIDCGGDREFLSARKAKLGRFVDQGVEDFFYVYDLRDSWEHVVRVEKVLEADPQVNYPRCLGGSRACPPEDCGGPRGYRELLKALRRSRPLEDGETLGRAGEFDAGAFDIEAVNKKLGTVR